MQTWVWHKPSWRRSPLTHQRAARTYTGLGNTLGGHKQNLVHQDPGERSSEPTRDWPRLACECPGLPMGGVGRWWPAAGSGALSVAVHAWDLLKHIAIIFITSTIVWPQVNNREWTQPHSSTENWIKDLQRMALPIRTRPSFPLSQSLPSGSFHKPLFLIGVDRMKTTITKKTNQTNTGLSHCKWILCHRGSPVQCY